MSDETKPDESTETQTQEKTFSQAEVDSLIKQRLGREQSKFSDYDDVKKQLETLQAKEKERLEAELTESEKLKKQIDELSLKFDELTLEKETLSKFKTDWEEEETVKVEKAMEGLDEDVKAQINDLPLNKRMFFIEKLKGEKPPSGEWSKTSRSEVITIEAIMEKKRKGDDSWRDDYKKYRSGSPEKVITHHGLAQHQKK